MTSNIYIGYVIEAKLLDNNGKVIDMVELLILK